MDLYALLHERYSTRSFKDKEVPGEVIEKLLEVARVAPTAHNNQAFHIYVLQGKGTDGIISKISACNYHAPLNLLITLKRKDSWIRQDGYMAADIDIGIVGTHIMLMSEELGLGCCWIGVINCEAAKEQLDLPSDEESVTILEIGYKAEDSKPGPWHVKRKTINQISTVLEIKK